MCMCMTLIEENAAMDRSVRGSYNKKETKNKSASKNNEVVNELRIYGFIITI